MQKKNLSLMLFSCLLLGQSYLYGQTKSNVKFGKVSPADFNLSGQQFDSGAAAVVIADIGSSVFVGNSKASFSLEFRHFKRMKILTKGGISAATVNISLYASGDDVEKLEGLKASTYNLENGSVVETKLDDKSLFTEQASKHRVNKKFTFPAVKEGSIIEYSYLQASPFTFELEPWEFQGEYPCLWSEYNADIPHFYSYVFLSQGYLPFDINTTSSTQNNFRVTFPGGAERDESYNFNDEVVSHHWVMKNVPAFKVESYTTTYWNYISKIEFQLERVQYPDQVGKDVMGTWAGVSESLLKEDDFGADLDRNNGWLDEDMKAITQGAATPLEKAKKIYAYVRDNFTCTSYTGAEANAPIKTIFKNKSGNVAGLNLVLDAMLLHEHIVADPIILSTRDNGQTNELYPLVGRFNYTICRAQIDDSAYFLDASEPWLGFGHIPGYCYNGQARVINKESSVPVYFNAGDITESKTTMVFLSNDDKGGITGSYQCTPGYFESSIVRDNVHKKGEKEYFKNVQAAYAGSMEIANTAIDSLKLSDEPVKLSYDLNYKFDTTEDILYFNPFMATEIRKENPFKSAERKYPVEMPYAMDETYILNMDIPAGYAVEEMPKSAKVLFNTDEGFFQFLIQKDATSIQMQSRIKLVKANYKPEEYAVLRDFFAYVVKKQGEQIVFKKKK